VFLVDLKCDDGYFHCADGTLCIREANKCDGYNQCADGSDEDNCGKLLSVFSAMNIYKMNMHHACLSTLVSVMQTDCCKMACMELTIDNIGYCA